MSMTTPSVAPSLRARGSYSCFSIEVSLSKKAWEEAKGRVRKVLEEFLGSGLASQRLPSLRAPRPHQLDLANPAR